MTRLAFFDMDGTLCEPNYFTGVFETIGFTEEGWIAFCAKNGENTYDNCRPLPRVAAYAASLKENGAVLYVLTGAITSIEVDAKRKFVKENYPDLFENVIAVPDEDRKLKVIRAFAEMHGVPLTECELVEDTYTTLLRAAAEGIRTKHVSAFLTEP